MGERGDKRMLDLREEGNQLQFGTAFPRVLPINVRYWADLEVLCRGRIYRNFARLATCYHWPVLDTPSHGKRVGA